MHDSDKCVGEAEPQAPRHISVESVDDGNRPLNTVKREEIRDVLSTEPRKQ